MMTALYLEGTDEYLLGPNKGAQCSDAKERDEYYIFKTYRQTRGALLGISSMPVIEPAEGAFPVHDPYRHEPAPICLDQEGEGDSPGIIQCQFIFEEVDPPVFDDKSANSGLSQFSAPSNPSTGDPKPSNTSKSKAQTRRASRRSARHSEMEGMMTSFRLDVFSYQDGVRARSSLFMRTGDTKGEDGEGMPVNDGPVIPPSHEQPLLFTITLPAPPGDPTSGEEQIEEVQARSRQRDDWSSSPSPTLPPLASTYQSHRKDHASLPLSRRDSSSSSYSVETGGLVFELTDPTALSDDSFQPRETVQPLQSLTSGQSDRGRARTAWREEDLKIVDEPPEWHASGSSSGSSSTFDLYHTFRAPGWPRPGDSSLLNAFEPVDFSGFSSLASQPFLSSDLMAFPGNIDFSGTRPLPPFLASMHNSLPSQYISTTSSLSGAIGEDATSNDVAVRYHYAAVSESGSGSGLRVSPASAFDGGLIKTHELLTGSGDRRRKHACSVPGCGKVFPRPSGLATHMNIHSGAKPYQCPVDGCPKVFSVRSNARRHLRTHGLRVRPRNPIMLSHKSSGRGRPSHSRSSIPAHDDENISQEEDSQMLGYQQIVESDALQTMRLGGPSDTGSNIPPLLYPAIPNSGHHSLPPILPLMADIPRPVSPSEHSSYDDSSSSSNPTSPAPFHAPRLDFHTSMTRTAEHWQNTSDNTFESPPHALSSRSLHNRWDTIPRPVRSPAYQHPLPQHLNDENLDPHRNSQSWRTGAGDGNGAGGGGNGNRRDREPWKILHPAKWRPRSLDQFKNASQLSSIPPFRFGHAGRPSLSLVTVPMYPRRPFKSEAREEERNSYESAPDYPYHPHHWNKLPGPAPLRANDFLTNAAPSESWD